MKFRLEKSSGSNHAATKFDVLDDAGTICGRITVAPEQASDLLSHWQEAPRNALAASAATGTKRAVNAMLAAGQRSNAPAPAAADSKERNPAVSAMLRVAHKNRLTKQAILRGC
jgi:hypothetical protein